MMKQQKELEWTILEAQAGLSRPKFWHYVVFSPSSLYKSVEEPLKEAIEKTIESLLSHEFTAGKHIEKMCGTTAKTIRINDADRLIFSIVDCHGIKIALVHHYILKHKLQEHRHLLAKPTIDHNEAVFRSKLSAYFETKASKIESTVVVDVESSRELRKMILNEQMITLTPRQTYASEMIIPLMQSGPGGSGKTLTAVVRIAETEGFSIVFIANTHLLIAQVNTLFHEWGISTHAKAIHYSDWIMSFASDRRLVGDEHFFSWYKDCVSHEQQVRKASKTKKINPMFSFESNEHLMTTMKYFSGRRLDECAKRHSLFPEEAHEHLLALFSAYVAYLDKTKVLHPAFYKIPEERLSACHELAVIDESQNLTLQQIENIFGQVQRTPEGLPAVVVNYDSHQAVDLHCSTRENILYRMTFNKARFEQHHIELQGIYRSPKSIVDLVNRFIGCVKYPLIKGRADVYEQNIFEKLEDDVLTEKSLASGWQWIKHSSEAETLEIEAPTWLVITHEEFQREAISRFGNACTFKEAVGLEYGHVCLYRPFDLPIFKSLDKALKNSPTALHPLNEAKKSSDLSSLPVLNQMISAMLRTTQSLVLIQNTSYVDNMYHRLCAAVEEKATVTAAPAISCETLLSQLKQFWKNGQSTYVQRAFEQEKTRALLGLTYEDFVASMRTPSTPNKQSSKKTAQPEKPSSRVRLNLFSEPVIPQKEAPTIKQGAIRETLPEQSVRDSFTAKSRVFREYVHKLYLSIPEVCLADGSKASQDLLTNLDALFKHKKCNILLCELVRTPDGPIPLLMALLRNQAKARSMLYYFRRRVENLRFLSEVFLTDDMETLEHFIVVAGDFILLPLLAEHRLLHRGNYNACDESPLYLAFQKGFLPYIKAYEEQFTLDDMALLRMRETSFPLSQLVFDYATPPVIASYQKNKNDASLWHPFFHEESFDFLYKLLLGYQNAVSLELQRNAALIHLKVGAQQFQPIHIAVQNRNTAMVEFLIKHGANVNATTTEGVTPLMIAFRINDILTACRLIFYKADFNFKSHVNGLSAFQIGYELKREVLLNKCLQLGVLSKEILSHLLSGPTFFSDIKQNYERVMLLSNAVKRGLTAERLTYFFESELFNREDFRYFHHDLMIFEQPRTLLDLLMTDKTHTATFAKVAKKIPKIMIFFGLSITQNHKDTVLHYAVEKNNRFFLKILLSASPSGVGIRNILGESVFQMAIRLKRKDMLSSFLTDLDAYFRTRNLEHFFDDYRTCILYDDLLTFEMLLHIDAPRLFEKSLSDAEAVRVQQLASFALRSGKIDFLESWTSKMREFGHQLTLVQMTDHAELFPDEGLSENDFAFALESDSSPNRLLF